MRKLSKYEKETIINWNEAENLASIYTFNASLKRRLADFSWKYPLLCRLERSTPEGSVHEADPQTHCGFFHSDTRLQLIGNVPLRSPQYPQTRPPDADVAKSLQNQWRQQFFSRHPHRSAVCTGQI